MGYEEDCQFVGPEFCEEVLDEKGLNREEEEAKFFGEL